MRFILKISIVFVLLTASIDPMRAAAQQSLTSPAPNNYSFTSYHTDQPNYTKTVNITDPDSSFNYIDTKYKTAVDRLKQQAAILKIYLKAKNYNTEYCFLVDMSIPSGKKRFFIYNIKKDSLEFSALVSHGYRSYDYGCNDVLQFSNLPYSSKTSLGKYKIGNSYYGHFGLAYKLYGLDSTNDKAYERDIVIHAHKNLPNNETYPEHIMESLGCPVVSTLFLTILTKYIKASKKPILMWVYN